MQKKCLKFQEITETPSPGASQKVELDETVRKPHENQSIGIVLCKSMNKAFVDFVIRDYDKPMGVATYKTSRDMPERLKKALPDMEDLKRLLMGDLDREEERAKRYEGE